MRYAQIRRLRDFTHRARSTRASRTLYTQLVRAGTMYLSVLKNVAPSVIRSVFANVCFTLTVVLQIDIFVCSVGPNLMAERAKVVNELWAANLRYTSAYVFRALLS